MNGRSDLFQILGGKPVFLYSAGLALGVFLTGDPLPITALGRENEEVSLAFSKRPLITQPGLGCGECSFPLLSTSPLLLGWGVELNPQLRSSLSVSSPTALPAG